MHKYIVNLLVFGLSIAVSQSTYAISLVALEELINSSKAPTIIDIRSNALYQKGHIQNAINIPATIIERKKLPELGWVVVYGDGINENGIAVAVEQLNAKPGIEAEALDGGASAWSVKHAMNNAQMGLDVSQTKFITYKVLQKMMLNVNSIILVDLRSGAKIEPLSEYFPNAHIHPAVSNRKRSKAKSKVSSNVLAGIPRKNRNVLVLIDDGDDGYSEKVADKLHAAGVKRLAILLGGDIALQARGEIVSETHRSGD